MNGYLVQVLAMLSGASLMFTCGINMGWPSPYMGLLQDPELSPVLLTSTEASWCAVSYLIGSPSAAFLAAPLIEKIGRKKFLLIHGPIMCLSFLAIAFAPNFFVLAGARFILGGTEGSIYTALPIYYGEISDPKIRGILGSSITFSSLLGSLFINAIGPFCTIKKSGIICSIIPLLHLISFVWLPETPYFLLKIGDDEKARKSLKCFRGTDDVQKELNELTMAVKRQQGGKKNNFFDLLKVPSYRKGILIYSIVVFGNQMSGKTPLLFYTKTIFETANGILDSSISVIIFSSSAIIATGLAITVIDCFGRRPLLIFSSLGCFLTLTIQAGYFTMQNFNPKLLENLSWIPIVTLIIYNVVLNLGLSFGPALLLTELFPISIKGKALCVAETIAVIYAVIASKFFHFAVEEVGMYLPFWTFGICSFCAALLIYFNVPETKGKTLEQIQLELIGNVEIRRKS